MYFLNSSFLQDFSAFQNTKRPSAVIKSTICISLYFFVCKGFSTASAHKIKDSIILQQWTNAKVTTESNVISFPVAMRKSLSAIAVDVEIEPSLVKAIGTGTLTGANITVAPMDYRAITVWVIGVL